jgi:hypothetical protein
MKLIALVLLMSAGCSAHAQFAAAGAPPTMSGWARGAGGFHSGRGASGGRSNVIFLGEPWLDGSNSAQPGTTYIVLPPQTTAAKPAEEAKPINPLLIELRGGQFVRVGSDAATTVAKIESPAVPRKPVDNNPVVLIFRDGHRENVMDYSIIGGHLYTSANYFQSGSWMRTIDLAALNLPATVDFNRQTGVSFLLPSGPNVVVTRP